VDGLACSLHCPMICSRQRCGGAFPRDAKPRGLDIWHCVDCMATCETKFYMKKPTFTRACLSDVRVIMVIIRVPLVELLCQAVME
jgi:hypothetical protein